MGWFSRSSTSTNAEAAPAAAETMPTATTAATTATATTTFSTTTTAPGQPDPSAPSTPDTNVNSTATEEVSSSTTEPIQFAHATDSVPVPPADTMRFDEYQEPEDIFARFKVSDAMNELAACSSLGSNIRNYYRYGTFKDCANRYDHLKFCMSIKTKSSQVAQVMIQKRDAELASKKASQPNSEDVWTKRSHPPPEFVELSRQE
ncbi:hypothetical protein BG004_005612 [Podila humilis]|nr:hypothetical protein BG004_005612 [Podila humilis]